MRHFTGGEDSGWGSITGVLCGLHCVLTAVVRWIDVLVEVGFVVVLCPHHAPFDVTACESEAKVSVVDHLMLWKS